MRFPYKRREYPIDPKFTKLDLEDDAKLEEISSYLIPMTIGYVANLYKLFWDDYSSWFLETIKPEYQKPIDVKTKSATLEFFDTLMLAWQQNQWRYRHRLEKFLSSSCSCQISGSRLH